MTTRHWNARLALWRTLGHGSAITRLIDRVLAHEPDAAMPREPLGQAPPRGPRPDLAVELEYAGRRHTVRATAVRAIVSQVAWLTSPNRVELGLIGNVPVRAAWPGRAGDAALRIRDGEGDLLLPFERLRIKRWET